MPGGRQVPDPQVVAVDDALAKELGLDPDDAAHRRGRAGPRRAPLRCPGSAAGGPGLRRPPVRRLLPPPGRRTGAAARRAARPRRPRARPAPQGLGPHPVRPGRRRQGRHRPDAAGVRDQRGHARARHPHHPVAGRHRHRRADRPREGLLPGAVLARVAAEPHPGRHVPVRRRHRGSGRWCGAWPTTPSPATTPRRPMRPTRTSPSSRRSPRSRPSSWPGGCSWGSSTAS